MQPNAIAEPGGFVARRRLEYLDPLQAVKISRYGRSGRKLPRTSLAGSRNPIRLAMEVSMELLRPCDFKACEASPWNRVFCIQIVCRHMRLRKGEVLIDSINSVEDTKGNNGERGALQVTNLRITWFSHKSFNTNLSIGYSCIQTISIRTAESTLRGRTQALFLMTKFNGARYEFVFTSLVKSSPRLFTTVQTVFRAFETSKLYRDLKLRGAAVRDGRLNQLPDEEVVRKVDGVWNLSSD